MEHQLISNNIIIYQITRKHIIVILSNFRCTNPLSNGCERVGSPQFVLNPVKSARIRTVNSFAFRYGRVEVKAKMPSGDWLWPAIWLMPKYNTYGVWPASGEIDMVESRGNKDLMLVSYKY